MKKQLKIVGVILVILALVLILLTFVLFGHNEKTKEYPELFVGTWEDPGFPDESFIFLSNQTGSWADTSMLWRIEDGKLVITLQMSGSEPEYTYEYSFSDNNKSLSLNCVSPMQVVLNLVKQ